ncbi:cell surface receptor IPT/TIG domain protein [Patulibacter medicamentivorans]|uniref:alpha-amylase n=1 Tax=Patulibacter medicamentivorans TaxID=1097667 RepID=H0EAR9_9ACTN|nr:hypothetical protein [Patulibacter medicamentivorans]EHN09244.1 cell surface receptor IPT/TIG domain protein [Patulibacter medicamentivorans]
MIVRRTALLVGLLLILVAGSPAAAYELNSVKRGAAQLPARWTTLPIDVITDHGPTDLTSETIAAMETWNNVRTARDVFGLATTATEDFTGANYGTAWGKLTGDGRHEIVVDEDFSAVAAVGFAPETVNGVTLNHTTVVDGVAVTDDTWAIVTLRGDRRSTLLHELGHAINIAHSSMGAYLGARANLASITDDDLPTMNFFTDSSRRGNALSADDAAAISDAYPDDAAASELGTIRGKVTRCDSGEPVLGANVRAVNVNDRSVQLARVTGFDGRDDGSYVIHGVPPGRYEVLVEPLTADLPIRRSLSLHTRVDSDFAQEFHTGAVESDCGLDADPSAKEPVDVQAGGSVTAPVEVDPVELALVVDTTKSMEDELLATVIGLHFALDDIAADAEAKGKPFPRTAIVSFKDTPKVELISRDREALKTALGGLTADGGGPCPEASNAALLAAGRMMAKNGRAILATDADSLPDGPSAETVAQLFTSKGMRISAVLAGTCAVAGLGEDRRLGDQQRSGAERAGGRRSDIAGPASASVEPVDELGAVDAVPLFSSLAAATGGSFVSAFPRPGSGPEPDASRAFADAVSNALVSGVMPAVTTAAPSTLPQDSRVTVELAGALTNFGPSSTVSVTGTGVQVVSREVRSPTRMLVTLAVAPDAEVGSRDVMVQTDVGGAPELARGRGALRIAEPPVGPTVVGAAPAQGRVGETLDVTVSATGSGFVDGQSGASFGSGVTVNRTRVTSPTSAVVNVTIGPGAKLGFHDVSVTTGGETADEQVTGPFLVVPQPPSIPMLRGATTPAARGDVVDVALTGVRTSFAADASVAEVLGGGVQVLSTTVHDATHATARVRVDPDAALGLRDLTISTGAEVATLLDGLSIAAVAGRPGWPVDPGPFVPSPPPAGPGTAGGPGPTPTAKAKATIAKRLRFDRRRRLLADVRCAPGGPACRGRLTVAVRVGRGSHVFAVTKLRLRAGRTQRLRLTGARTTLRRAAGGRRLVTVAVRLDDGARTTLSRRLRFPKPR